MRGLTAGDLLDQPQVVGGQVDAVPVGALGLVRAADEDKRDVAGPRDRDRLGEEVLLVGVRVALGAVVDGVAGREEHRARPSRR